MQKLSIAVEAKALATLRTGVGQYIYQLYRVMESMSDKPDIYYQINNHFVTTLPSERVISTSNSPLSHKERLSKLIDNLGTTVTVAKKKLALNLYRKTFNLHLQEIKPDIIHCTDFFSIDNKRGIPEIITVHDISCFKYPETHPAARVQFFNEYLPASLEKAQHILTVSEFSKREIVDYFAIKAEKITVTYNGLPVGFQAYSEIQTALTIKQYDLQYKKFFLYVGTIEPRKNLEILLDAYQKLPKDIQSHYKLVIIGACGWKFESFLQQAGGLLKRQQLIMPGYVSDKDLKHLMASAHCFLYPSIYEGFGLPPLEAMASGTPVITSDCASLPEVVGNAGVLLPADDAQQWTQAITSLVDDPQQYQRYVTSGVQRAALFSWKTTAEKTLNCFQKVCV